MTDPSEVVLRYTPEKWIEAQERLGSASPSRFVTLSYQPRDQLLGTPSPSRERTSAPPVRRHVRPNLSSTEYFVRPISESLERLASYGKTPGADVQVEEKNWYHDLTNVGQRLRLLRETFKVIQLVRKKRMMGERADFKMLNDFRTSHTGSPLVLDDDGHSRTEDEDEANASSAPEVPPPPPPNRRGRPRKKQTRGRKPGPRRETAGTPVTRTRASRRVQEPAVLSLLKEQALAAPQAAGDEPRNLVYSSPPDAPSTHPILHLPPILPSQRLPYYHGQAPSYGQTPSYTQAPSYGQASNYGQVPYYGQPTYGQTPGHGTLPYIPGEGPHTQAPLSTSIETNAPKAANAPSASTPAASGVVGGDSASMASTSASLAPITQGSLAPNAQGTPPGPAQSVQNSATPFYGNFTTLPANAESPPSAKVPFHSAIPLVTGSAPTLPSSGLSKNSAASVSSASNTPKLPLPDLAPIASTTRSTPTIPTNHFTSNITTAGITPEITKQSAPNLGASGILHSSTLPSMRMSPTISDRLLPHFGVDSRNPLLRVDGMTGSFAIPQASPGFVPTQGSSAGIRLPPLQWGSGTFSMPGMPRQSPPSYFPGGASPKENKE